MPRVAALALALLLRASVCLALGGEPTFTPARDADALDQPDGRPLARVKAGELLRLLKKGGPGKAWCKVRTDQGDAWLRCAEGETGTEGPPASRAPAAPEPPPTGTRGSGAAGAACPTKCDRAPLFKAMPELTKAEREVLGMCPLVPDAAVTKDEVRRFFERWYEDRRVQRALSAAGRPGSGAGVREANIDWLAGLWTGTGPRNAFTHVFCGDEWGEPDLGGLHWLPRYAQLETEGRLCYGGPARGGALPEKGGQYLVKYRGLAPWSCGKKNIGGFPVRTDPVDMVAIATRAFVRCCGRTRGNDGGVFKAKDLGGPAWRIWCGTRNGTYGIATVYPTDEKPTCGD